MTQRSRLAGSAPWCIGLLLTLALFCDGLAKGGRWVLNEAIAMDDRRGTPHFGYSHGMADGFAPSTPYFPGVGALAGIAQAVAPGHDVALLLALGALSVLALLAGLAQVYRRLGGGLTAGEFVAVASVLALAVLPDWLRHADELKPDTLALAAFVAAWLAVDGTRASQRPLRALVAGLGVTLAIVLKQQAIVLVLGLAAGMALRDWRLRRVGSGWVAMAAGTMVGVAVALSVPGAWRFAVVAHTGRPLQWDFEWGQLRFAAALVALLLLMLAARRFSKRPPVLHDPGRTEVPFAPAALLWALAGVAGALNLGGNLSNVQSGLVLTLPWVVLAFERLSPSLLRLGWRLGAVLMLGFLVLGGWHERYETRRAIDTPARAVIQALPAPVVLASSSSYLSVRGLPGVRVHEIDAWAHYRHGRLHAEVPGDSPALVRSLRPDVIVYLEGCALQARLYGLVPAALGYRAVRLAASPDIDRIFVRPAPPPEPGLAPAQR